MKTFFKIAIAIIILLCVSFMIYIKFGAKIYTKIVAVDPPYGLKEAQIKNYKNQNPADTVKLYWYFVSKQEEKKSEELLTSNAMEARKSIYKRRYAPIKRIYEDTVIKHPDSKKTDEVIVVVEEAVLRKDFDQVENQNYNPFYLGRILPIDFILVKKDGRYMIDDINIYQN